MYRQPQYQIDDPQVVMDFIQNNPFAMIIGAIDGQPVATQVPVFIDKKEDGTLQLSGHISRKTDHQLAFENNEKVLAVFTGPHAYVSASWYTNPKMASTWNYMSVHVKGTLRLGTPAELVQNLKRLSLHFESYNTESPTVYDNLEADYLAKMEKAIVYFEITVSEIQQVFKLSQNRDEISYQNIIDQLQKGDAQAQAIAAEMEKRKSILFTS